VRWFGWRGRRHCRAQRVPFRPPRTPPAPPRRRRFRGIGSGVDGSMATGSGPSLRFRRPGSNVLASAAIGSGERNRRRRRSGATTSTAAIGTGAGTNGSAAGASGTTWIAPRARHPRPCVIRRRGRPGRTTDEIAQRRAAQVGPIVVAS
jgi:hypothetical protein